MSSDDFWTLVAIYIIGGVIWCAVGKAIYNDAREQITRAQHWMESEREEVGQWKQSLAEGYRDRVIGARMFVAGPIWPLALSCLILYGLARLLPDVSHGVVAAFRQLGVLWITAFKGDDHAKEER